MAEEDKEAEEVEKAKRAKEAERLKSRKEKGIQTAALREKFFLEDSKP